MRRPAFLARRTHKWIAWIVGVQALLWMASGLYMTAISIDIIHGDYLVQPPDTTPLQTGAQRLDADELLARHPGLTSFKLKRFMGSEVFEVRESSGTAVLVDVRSGARLGPINQEGVRALALSHYRGSAPIEAVEWLEEAPAEVSTRPVPLWRVSFADRKETSLYFSPHTGELLAKRHDLWRWFDVMWMLHIMDYEERSDINNLLLKFASVLGLAFSASGVWLLFYSFRWRRRT